MRDRSLAGKISAPPLRPGLPGVPSGSPLGPFLLKGPRAGSGPIPAGPELRAVSLLLEALGLFRSETLVYLTVQEADQQVTRMKWEQIFEGMWRMISASAIPVSLANRLSNASWSDPLLVCFSCLPLLKGERAARAHHSMGTPPSIICSNVAFTCLYSSSVYTCGSRRRTPRVRFTSA